MDRKTATEKERNNFIIKFIGNYDIHYMLLGISIMHKMIFNIYYYIYSPLKNPKKKKPKKTKNSSHKNQENSQFCQCK